MSEIIMPDTVCAAFWKHINVRSDNMVYACCRYKTPVMPFDGDLEKVLHSPAWQQLRHDSLAGVVNPNCQKCYDAVDSSMSLQSEFNHSHSTDSVSLEFLEIGFDNICNLTCVGCSPEFSSAWADQASPDTRRINIRSTVEIESVPDSVRQLLFLGGEPLMTNRHRRFLDLVPRPSQVSVVYNTNGTFLLDHATIDRLSQFSNVKFIVSIDGLADLNTVVRPGSDWQQILCFIQQIQSLGHALEINTVIHSRNYFGIVDLAQFAQRENIPQRVNILTYPAHLDIRYLENTQLTEFAQQLSQCQYTWADTVLRYIKNFAPVVEW